MAEGDVPAIGPFSSLTKTQSSDEFSVVINNSQYCSTDDLVAYCRSQNKDPSLYILLTAETTDICNLMKGNVRQVCIFGDSSLSQSVTASGIEIYPSLTHLCFTQTVISENTLVALSKAMNMGHFPQLSHLSFGGCGTVLKGKLSLLLSSKWLTLTHLNLKGSCLEENDIQILSPCLGCPDNAMLPYLSYLVLDFGDELPLTGNENNREGICSAMYSMFQFPLISIKPLLLYNINPPIHQMIVWSLSQGKYQIWLNFPCAF